MKIQDISQITTTYAPSLTGIALLGLALVGIIKPTDDEASSRKRAITQYIPQEYICISPKAQEYRKGMIKSFVSSEDDDYSEIRQIETCPKKLDSFCPDSGSTKGYTLEKISCSSKVATEITEENMYLPPPNIKIPYCFAKCYNPDQDLKIE
ncbi:MAG: hypothetical protein WC254_06600 [Candidatus Woesearchaeota archaeon]|jgi:hypothetical protein